jgi:hypothetical protein
MHPGLSNKLPFKHATIENDEKHICTIVMNEAIAEKMFGFFGPILYQNSGMRYHGHLTNKRLILEVYPYSGIENIAMKAALTILKSNAPGAGHARSAQLKLAKAAMEDPKAAMEDPNGKWLSFTHEVVNISLFKYNVVGLLPKKLIRLNIEGLQDRFFFITPAKNIGNPLTVSQFTDDFIEFYKKISKEFNF